MSPELSVPSGRISRVFMWLGRGYLIYHALAATMLLVMLFSVETFAGYWRDPGVLVVILLGPLFIPAIALSGGPHNFGADARLLVALPLLLLMLLAAGSSVWMMVRRLGQVLGA